MSDRAPQPAPIRSESLRVAAGLVASFAIFLAVAWPAVATTPFFTKGEPREALVVQAMARGEGWILPRRNADEVPSKPPLFHWLAAAVASIRGEVDEAAVRIPSLVTTTLAAAATAAVAGQWWGSRAAIAAAIVLLGSGQWLASSVTARVDGVLASAVSLALLAAGVCLARGRAIPTVCFALVAAAVLAKGPVGAALPAVVVVSFLVAEGRVRDLGRRELQLFAAALVVASCWYVAAFLAAGDAFFVKQIVNENLFRVLDPDAADVGHVRPFWYYLPLLAGGFAPWSLFLPAVFVVLARRGALAEPEVRYAGTWALVTVVLFSLAGSKRAVYLLPCYPALALLAARAWTLIEPGDRIATGWVRAGAGITAVIFSGLGLVLLGGAVGAPLGTLLARCVSETDARNVPALLATLHSRPMAVGLAGAALLSAALLLARRTIDGRARPALAGVALGIFATAATVSTSLLPPLAAARSMEGFMERVAVLVPENEPLFFYRAFDYGAVFYRGQPIPQRTELPEQATTKGAWLLTWRDSVPAVEEATRQMGADAAAVSATAIANAEDPSSLALVHIAKRTGDERVDGN